MEKKLIYRDRQAETAFLSGVESARERSNELLNIFHTLQDWERITSLEEFITFVSDPELYYDRVMIRNLKAGAPGNGKINPEALAVLFDVPRQSYINILRGIYYEDPGCVPCHKLAKKKGGKPCITSQEFQRYKPFLLFSEGIFTVNEEAVNKNSESFNTYAETSGQLEIVAQWEHLVETLNGHDKLYPMTLGVKQAIGKGLDLYLSRASEGEFLLNVENLRKLIYGK